MKASSTAATNNSFNDNLNKTESQASNFSFGEFRYNVLRKFLLEQLVLTSKSALGLLEQNRKKLQTWLTKQSLTSQDDYRFDTPLEAIHLQNQLQNACMRFVDSFSDILKKTIEKSDNKEIEDNSASAGNHKSGLDSLSVQIDAFFAKLKNTDEQSDSVISTLVIGRARAKPESIDNEIRLLSVETKQYLLNGFGQFSLIDSTFASDDQTHLQLLRKEGGEEIIFANSKQVLDPKTNKKKTVSREISKLKCKAKIIPCFLQLGKHSNK